MAAFFQLFGNMQSDRHEADSVQRLRNILKEADRRPGPDRENGFRSKDIRGIGKMTEMIETADRDMPDLLFFQHPPENPRRSILREHDGGGDIVFPDGRQEIIV